MRYARWSFAILTALMCTAGVPASAQPLFDNWNTQACNVTEYTGFVVPRPTLVRRIDIWFRWNANETSVGYAVARNREVVATGELSRAECDPHQAAWCVARVEPNIELEAGDWIFKTDRPGICQNAGSQGVGFIRVFGSAE